MKFQAIAAFYLASSIYLGSAGANGPQNAFVEIYNAGDCTTSPSKPLVENVWISETNHACITMKTPHNYGAKLRSSSEMTCQIKAWELPGCHGKATLSPQRSNPDQCIPIANKDNQFYLGGGASSFSIECVPKNAVTLPASTTSLTNKITTTITATKVYHSPGPSTAKATSTFSISGVGGTTPSINGNGAAAEAAAQAAAGAAKMAAEAGTLNSGEGFTIVIFIEISTISDAKVVDTDGNEIRGYSEGETISQPKGPSGTSGDDSPGDEGQDGHID